MKYKLIGRDNRKDIKGTIFKNREVEDVNAFLNLDIDVTHSFELLDNIDFAISTLLNHIEQDHKILIQVDSDCDGYTSSALLYMYIKCICPDADLVFRVHSGKEHGLIPETIGDDIDLIILPDSSSNDYTHHKEVANRGIDIIVLDHHEAERYSEYAVVVNNKMSPRYPNKDLAGVGVVYKFCKCIDKRLGVSYADKYLDLVALGCIGDSVDTRALETRYYIQKGLNNIQNPFFKAIIEKQDYSMKGKVNINSVSFYVVPLINATVRFGTQEEKIAMFNAFIDDGSTLVKYKKRGATEEIDVPLVEDMARVCSNVKAKQDRQKEKALEIVVKRIEEKELDKNKILFVTVGQDEIEPTLTGLLANNLASKYHKPTVILRPDEKSDEVFSGSARGYEKSELKNFKKLLEDTKKFIYTLGHNNAFGVKICRNSLIEVNDYLNQLLANVSFENFFDVDFAIPSDEMSLLFVQELYEMQDLWGHNFDEPYVAITNVTLSKGDISIIGKTSDTIKFKANGIEYIIFHANLEKHAELLESNNVVLDIVGRCDLNIWNNRAFPQVIVEDYNIIDKPQFVF